MVSTAGFFYTPAERGRMGDRPPRAIIVTPTEEWIEGLVSEFFDSIALSPSDLLGDLRRYLSGTTILIVSSSGEPDLEELRRRMASSDVNPLSLIPLSLSHLAGEGREEAARAALSYALSWAREAPRLTRHVKRVVRPPPRRISRRELLRLPRTVWAYPEAPKLVGSCAGPLASSCRRCEEACPHEALTVTDAGPAISEVSCLDCGLCAAVCPTGALQIPTFTDWQASHLQLLSPEGERTLPWIALFTCDAGLSELARLRVESTHILPIRVPCVGAAGWFAILRAAESGVDAVALYCPQPDCERRGALDGISREGSKLALLLRQAGVELFFLEGGPQSILRAADAVKVREGGARVNPSELTLQRRRDLVAMALNLCTSPVTVEGLIYGIDVDERCTLCGVCAEKCPLGSLRMEESGDQVSLTFRPDLCIGCGRCLEVCPESAMTLRPAELDPGEDPSAPRVLRSDEIARCAECGAPIGPKSLVMAVYSRLRDQGMEKAAEAVLLCQRCRARKMLEGLA